MRERERETKMEKRWWKRRKAQENIFFGYELTPSRNFVRVGPDRSSIRPSIPLTTITVVITVVLIKLSSCITSAFKVSYKLL